MTPARLYEVHLDERVSILMGGFDGQRPRHLATERNRGPNNW